MVGKDDVPLDEVTACAISVPQPAKMGVLTDVPDARNDTDKAAGEAQLYSEERIS